MWLFFLSNLNMGASPVASTVFFAYLDPTQFEVIMFPTTPTS